MYSLEQQGLFLWILKSIYLIILAGHAVFGKFRVFSENFHQFKLTFPGIHDKEWEIVEKERFAEYDTNKDNLLNLDEIRPWVLTDNLEESEEEADHLIKHADQNGDGKLSEMEIVDAHEDFVGNQATDFGRHLHFVKHKDEL